MAVLNLHERWLLLRVGLHGQTRHALLAEVIASRRGEGEVDLLGQEGGYKLVKRSAIKDLRPMFDRILSPYEISVDHVVYGHRRFKWYVIVAAALQSSGVSIEAFRQGRANGLHELTDFERLMG